MGTNFNIAPAGAPAADSETAYHAGSSTIACQAVGNRTAMAIGQLPDEAVMRRRAYYQTLGLTKGAPRRVRATDRLA